MAEHAITRARVSEFGPFGDVDLGFSPGLNVVVGDNATGKSQILKLLYVCTKALREAKGLTKKDLSSAVAEKLVGTYRPESLGRLTRRVQGTSRARVLVKYAGIGNSLNFQFSSRAQREVIVHEHPARSIDEEPVFLPSHELLSMASGFLGLYDTYETGFEETWRDTVELLLRPALRGPRGQQANVVLEPFSALLQGGSVVEANGQFYLRQPGIGNLEAPLLAEGHRKLAMVVRLIANGAILEGGYLFWDEPEANLNPASQRAVAHALTQLANSGAQVFVATHSMFLLREIQMSRTLAPPTYIGLARNVVDSEEVALAEVVAEQSDDLEELAYVAALAAEAEQAQRYLAW